MKFFWQRTRQTSNPISPQKPKMPTDYLTIESLRNHQKQDLIELIKLQSNEQIKQLIVRLLFASICFALLVGGINSTCISLITREKDCTVAARKEGYSLINTAITAIVGLVAGMSIK
jgi:hypothetical protein